MKKLSFLIVVFIFTTAGIFKSALEECADIGIRDATQFNKNGVYKEVEMSDAEKLVAKREWEKRVKEHELNKKNKRSDIGFFIDSKYNSRTHNTVLIRKISKKENEKKYKKFISQSLKKKMNDTLSSYGHHYSECVNYKKHYPEVFKAKYD